MTDPIADTGISYQLKKSTRARRLTIRLDVYGNVLVTAPIRFPKYKIAQFVESARDWINMHRQKMQLKPVLFSSQHVYIFGKKYTIQKTKNRDGSIRISGSMVYIAPLSVSDNLVPFISKWLKAQASTYIAKRTYALAEKMETPFKNIAFKQQKTRWGSCSSDKNLNFNWKLIHAPKPVIDYVIIHELAHIKYMHHKRSFWDFVAKFDPNYPLHRRWLSKYGSTED